MALRIFLDSWDSKDGGFPKLKAFFFIFVTVFVVLLMFSCLISCF